MDSLVENNNEANNIQAEVISCGDGAIRLAPAKQTWQGWAQKQQQIVWKVRELAKNERDHRSKGMQTITVQRIACTSYQLR